MGLGLEKRIDLLAMYSLTPLLVFTLSLSGILAHTPIAPAHRRHAALNRQLEDLPADKRATSTDGGLLGGLLGGSEVCYSSIVRWVERLIR